MNVMVHTFQMRPPLAIYVTLSHFIVFDFYLFIQRHGYLTGFLKKATHFLREAHFPPLYPLVPIYGPSMGVDNFNMI